jgi:hypothetical protein
VGYRRIIEQTLNEHHDHWAHFDYVQLMMTLILAMLEGPDLLPLKSNSSDGSIIPAHQIIHGTDHGGQNTPKP